MTRIRQVNLSDILSAVFHGPAIQFANKLHACKVHMSDKPKVHDAKLYLQCFLLCKRPRYQMLSQVGSQGGAEEAALRPYWRGRMGTSKQEQLDLFEGRLPSDEDFSDTEEEQDSIHQQHVITAAPDSSSQPSRSFSSWQSHESAQAAPEQASSQCFCQTEELKLGNSPPGDDERNPVDPKQDSSSSGEDSSSSESDSNSSSDDDPDDVQPIQIRKALW